ncbi:MAG: N-acetylmuramoyl-L-alanine amidase [Proteobacteria bacterium]|nr:MAG: N-acetylmuramoyl-L-alanine amidase [Pseudomonadota bacterium]
MNNSALLVILAGMCKIGLIIGILLGALAADADELPLDLCGKPSILTRTQWGAREPVFKLSPQSVRGLVIHHSGMPQDRTHSFFDHLTSHQRAAQKPQLLAGGKMRQAWGDLPYHFIINWDGQIAEGREVKYAGDTNTHYDPANRILIDVEGNFEEIEPSPAQLQSLTKLTAYLTHRYQYSTRLITGHRDETTGTVCPGKNLYELIPEVILNAERLCPSLVELK